MSAACCAALLCTKKTRSKYCRAHRACVVHEAFGAAVRLWLESHGAVLDADGPHGWRFFLETRVGRLRVSFHPTSYAIFTQFDDVDRAVAVIGKWAMNDYSGKWNHHMSDGNEPAQAALYVVNAFERLLVKV